MENLAGDGSVKVRERLVVVLREWMTCTPWEHFFRRDIRQKVSQEFSEKFQGKIIKSSQKFDNNLADFIYISYLFEKDE
jgi:hypothetical protein